MMIVNQRLWLAKASWISNLNMYDEGQLDYKTNTFAVGTPWPVDISMHGR